VPRKHLATKIKPLIGTIPQPKTQLEANIAEKFGWDYYIFQFPPLIERYYKPKKMLADDFTTIIRVPAVYHKRSQPIIYDTAKLPPNLTPTQLHEALKWQYKKLNLPKGFKEEFPYLDKVIRDQILTSIVNKHIADHAEDRLSSMNKIVFQLIKMVIDLIHIIWQIPGAREYLANHPSDLQTVSSAAQVSQFFLADRIDFPQLTLDPQYQKNTIAELKSK
jgi:hypothetical protein